MTTATRSLRPSSAASGPASRPSATAVSPIGNGGATAVMLSGSQKTATPVSGSPSVRTASRTSAAAANVSGVAAPGVR